MMETWYTFDWNDELQKVEAIKSTPKQIVILRESWGGKKYEQRIQKHTQWRNYFPTKQQAIDFERERLERKLEAARNKFDACNKLLSEFSRKYPKQ